MTGVSLLAAVKNVRPKIPDHGREVHHLAALSAVALPAERLKIVQRVRPAQRNRHDMVLARSWPTEATAPNAVVIEFSDYALPVLRRVLAVEFRVSHPHHTTRTPVGPAVNGL